MFSFKAKDPGMMYAVSWRGRTLVIRRTWCTITWAGRYIGDRWINAYRTNILCFKNDYDLLEDRLDTFCFVWNCKVNINIKRTMVISSVASFEAVWHILFNLKFSRQGCVTLWLKCIHRLTIQHSQIGKRVLQAMYCPFCRTAYKI